MSGKILVIDDEPLILKTIARALAKVGYDVTTTARPDSFLSALRQKGADLLIVDLHLGGHDTSALIDSALKISPAAKVLIVSGSSKARPGYRYLQKPFQISDLREIVRELINEP